MSANQNIAAVVAITIAGSLSMGCSLGQGEGKVSSDKLIATDCWNDQYDLQPDFFAAIPYRDTQVIRVQRGSDLEEVSDGLDVLVDQTSTIRQAIADASGKTPKSFPVSLPAGVHAPGTPIVPPTMVNGELPVVHMALYLQRSCHNQNTILYSISGSITFNSLFSGNPNEKDAAQKFTDATFDIQVGDPRDAPTGEQVDKIPQELQSHVTGYFRFYFERGQPAQPFP